MLAWVKKNWGISCLFVLVGFIVLINFKFGSFILGNDNYSPELNPGLSLSRYLFEPGWRSYRVVGVASDADQADFFRTLIFYLLSQVVPKWLLSQGYIWFCLFAGVVGSGLLCKNLAQRFSYFEGKKLELVAFFGGVLYLSNLLTIWQFYSPLIPFLATWGFLPMLLFIVSKIFFQNNVISWLWFLFLSLWFTTVGIVPTIFITSSLVLFFWIVFLGLVSKQAKKGIAMGAIFLGVNLHWILPFVVYIKTNSLALQESFINRYLTPYFQSTEQYYNKFWAVPRFMFSWLFTINDDGSLYYPFLNFYSENKLALLLSCLPIIFLFLGIGFMFRKKTKSGLVLIVPFLLGWIIIAGKNEPFGLFFTWMQEHIPLFGQVFRWQSSKVWPAVLYPMVFFGSIGVTWLSGWFGKKQLVVSFLFAGILLGYIWPVWSGAFFSNWARVEVPQVYFELEKYLDVSGTRGRIFLAPEANMLYFRSHSWGFYGSSFLNYVIANPIVEKALTTGSQEAENVTNNLISQFYLNDSKQMASSLQKFKTELVLLDKSVAKQKNGYAYDPLDWKQFDDPDSFELIWQKDFLYLYKVKYKISKTDSIYLANGQDRARAMQLANTINENLVEKDANGLLYPWAWQSIGDGLFSYKYQGDSRKYELSFGQEEVGSAPIALKKENENVIISAALPKLFVNGIEQKYDLPSARFTLTDKVVKSDLLSVDEQVFENEGALVSGKHVSDFRLGQSEVKSWLRESIVKEKLNPEGNRFWKIFDKDSVVEYELVFNNPSEKVVTICAWSEYQKGCLGGGVIIGIGTKKVKQLLPEIVFGGDKITWYVDGEETAGDMVVDYWSDYKSLVCRDCLVNMLARKVDKEITINKGDNLLWVAPAVAKGGGNFGWKYTGVNLERLGLYGGKDNVVLMTFGGKNVTGIPTEFYVKNSLTKAYLARGLLKAGISDNQAMFFPVPDSGKNLDVGVFNYDLNTNKNENNLDYFNLRLIPRVWLGIRLTPVDGSYVVKNDVKVLNQAVSRIWNKDAGVVVNGWEQGYEDTNMTEVSYGSNYLAWAGYGLGSLISLGTVLFVLSKSKSLRIR